MENINKSMATPKEQDEKIKEIIGRQLDKIDDKEMFSVEECMREYGEYISASAIQKAREEERERFFQKICLVRGSIRDKALFEATEVFVTALDHSELNQDNK